MRSSASACGCSRPRRPRPVRPPTPRAPSPAAPDAGSRRARDAAHPAPAPEPLPLLRLHHDRSAARRGDARHAAALLAARRRASSRSCPTSSSGQAVRMRVRLLKGEHPELRTSIVAAPGAPAVFGGPAPRRRRPRSSSSGRTPPPGDRASSLSDTGIAARAPCGPAESARQPDRSDREPRARDRAVRAPRPAPGSGSGDVTPSARRLPITTPTVRPSSSATAGRAFEHRGTRARPEPAPRSPNVA